MTDGTVDEPTLLCQEIARISGGGTSTSYGELAKDERVEQIFEALMGTLKAAKKRGLITFEGELLLMGKDDKVIISLTDAGAGCAGAPAPADAPGAGEDAAAAEEAVAAVEKAAAEKAEAEAAEKAAAEKAAADKAEAERAAAAAAAEQAAAAEAAAAAEQAAAEAAAAEEVLPAPQAPPADDAPGLEEGADDATQAQKSGKWKVDTSYIDWRTADPNRLEPRRDSASTTAEGSVQGPPVGSEARKSVKAEDGKWQQVDTGYINHRTQDCDRLEGRRGSQKGSADDAASATVKKDDEGKWKVDMTYVQHRTKDTANLIRKEEKNDHPDYANPDSVKFPYEELKKPLAERNPEIDPTRREQYLSEEDFQMVFEMSVAEFNRMPKWKQQNQKKAKDLF